MPNLEKGGIIRSPTSGRRYRLGELLGHGGYGRAFHALDLGKRRNVCLKYTFDQNSWLRECYFGELLRSHPRVVQVLDAFPYAPGPWGHARIHYFLVLELAEHGSMTDYLGKQPAPWSETRARQEICALLALLDQLHGGSATHRDITPLNVFVCKKGLLKLGDFGIARHQLAGRPTKPEAFNPDYVTRGFIDSDRRVWSARDDVFQMGQLLAMLLAGQPRKRVRAAQIDRLPISHELAQILHRAIGPRRARYHDAWEMLRALQKAPKRAQLRSLRGKTVAFAGKLSIARTTAEKLVRNAGGVVAKTISREVDVLVRAKTRAREVGQAEALLRHGHRIHIIGEPELRQLARAT